MSFEVLLVYFALLLIIAVGGRYLFSPFRFAVDLLLKGGGGFLLLILFNLLTRFTGYALPLNIYTVLYCGFLGLPGVISLCFLQTWL
ncbi:MAG: SigmaK-factor processing regulatory BofA [Firmicutes bacterium]|nr:SigmaK-factor processing regulatory BofA [Bacillota bacterium]